MTILFSNSRGISRRPISKGHEIDMYGKYWRCWQRKATQQEMENHPWEGGRRRMIKISDQNNDFGAVLICAVRYCIGRQTYMPGLVIDFIRPLLPKLDSKTLTVMERDIIEADSLGDEQIDQPKWLYFLNDIREEKQRRIKP